MKLHYKKISVAFAAILMGLLLFSCSNNDSSGTGSSGADSLQIIATNPSNNKTGVPIDQMFAISFSEPIDPDSVTEDSIV